MIPGFYRKQKIHIKKLVRVEGLQPSFTNSSELDREKMEEYHQIMLVAGFDYDKENDFYFTQTGALMFDGVDDIRDVPQATTWIKRGYELGYGSPTPFGRQNGKTKAIYCTNYLDIVEKYGVKKQEQNPTLK